MYDAGKIIPGLVIFFVLLISPVWYSVATGGAANPPEPKIVTEEKKCVEPTPYMRAEHARLLEQWKQSVTRQGLRTYAATDGREFNMSLTGTCLDCHSNKKEFCDQCHSYVGVKPFCWDCHIIPESD